jgi:DNA-binding IclR family transcriptional regulator
MAVKGAKIHQTEESVAAAASFATDAGWTRYLDSAAPQGAQGTVRIAALLRIVAAHNASGMKLNEIGRLAGLEQSTAHRIVTALTSVGFLARESQTRRYHLGPLLFELFTTAFPHFNVREICLPSMTTLAEQMGDTVYLTVRSGFDGICVERREGSYPIRTCTVEVGQRRPLGVGAGSLALLAALRDMEINTVLEQNAERYPAFGTSAEAIRNSVERVRAEGHVHQDAVTSSDVKAVALPIKGKTDHPFGALSMTAIASRMTPERAQDVLTGLRHEIDRIELKISALGYV